MYEEWVITRWETPVGDIDRLLMVSLIDRQGELQLVVEAFRASNRPRWRVTFRDYPAYRNIDERYRDALWRWLDASAQRCGTTFTVRESPAFSSWGATYLGDVNRHLRHFVVSTADDVIEVLSAGEPVWEVSEAAGAADPLPGKARHLYLGEDDAEIAELAAELKRRNRIE
jgi:hypothetical protein